MWWSLNIMALKRLRWCSSAGAVRTNLQNPLTARCRGFCFAPAHPTREIWHPIAPIIQCLTLAVKWEFSIFIDPKLQQVWYANSTTPNCSKSPNLFRRPPTAPA